MVIEELRSVREAAARAGERGHCAWQRDGGNAFPLDFEQNIVCLFIRWQMRKYARCAAYSVTLESECSYDVALCADRTRFSTKGLLSRTDRADRATPTAFSACIPLICSGQGEYHLARIHILVYADIQTGKSVYMQTEIPSTNTGKQVRRSSG